MQDDQYENRKEYIKKIRESFDKEDLYTKSGFRDNISIEEAEPCVRSFWKLRLLVAVLCFIAVFMMRQTGWENQWISEKKIVFQIQKNYDTEKLKENMRRLSSFFDSDR